MYKQRDEEQREQFLETVSKLDEKDLVYIDETGIDHEQIREYARSKRGVRVYGNKLGRTSRTTLIAGEVNNKLIAPLKFIGYTTTELVLQWLRKQLLPNLRKGMTLILDNATFHKSQEIVKLVESFGCSLLFLPPYSPDFNPIEKLWSNLKHKLKSLNTVPTTFNKNLNKVIRDMSIVRCD